MTITGRIENGVVVLPQGVRLREGENVTVVAAAQKAGAHSVLDIPSVSVGSILKPLTRDDDLLEEMLESRLCCLKGN